MGSYKKIGNGLALNSSYFNDPKGTDFKSSIYYSDRLISLPVCSILYRKPSEIV